MELGMTKAELVEKVSNQIAHKVGIIGSPKIIKETPRVGFLDWVLKSTVNQSLINRSSIPSLQYTWHFNSLH